MGRIRSLLILIFIGLAFTGQTVLAKSAAGEPESSLFAVRGTMEVKSSDYQEGKQRVPLQGEWEFYWKQLLEPQDFQHSTPVPNYIQVPSTWVNQPLGGAVDSSYGYATYRILLKLPADDIGRSKSLYLKSIGSAYRIWIDGKEKPGLGVVGTNRENETPQAHINLVFMQPERENVEIVIQTSNFSFRDGGIISEIDYGDTSYLIVYILKKMFYDIFVMGGFAIIGLFHIIAFGFRKKDTPTLFIGLLSLAISARTLFINGFLSSVIFNINSWELLTKLEYLSENIGFLFLVLLIWYMYPKEAHRYMVYLSFAIALVLSIFVIGMPARVYTESMIIQTSLKVIVLCYFVFYVGIVAFLRKREGSIIILISVLILIVALLNDTLYYARWVRTIEMFSIGAIMFVLAQAIIVSYRYARLSKRNDSLVTELVQVNESLEEKVVQRTQGLKEINEELSEMKEHRTKLLMNISHDLGSPMIGIQTYLQLMVEGKLPEERQGFNQQVLEKTAYIRRLIQDLFELSKLESREQSFHFEEIEVGWWLEDIKHKFTNELQQSNFTLQTDRFEETDRYLKIDSFRMLQLLQNYIDNAIKFSGDHSRVIAIKSYLSAGKVSDQEELVVEIIDEGVGIAEEELQYVFQRFFTKREGNERGSGLGLAIVKEIIAQHHGTAGVKSVLGQGSSFYFTLPVIKKTAV